jgi:hypothetical protein
MAGNSYVERVGASDVCESAKGARRSHQASDVLWLR